MGDIKLCPVCNGEGETTKNIGTHSSEYVCCPCTRCNSTGRIITMKISYDFDVPFGTSLTKWHNISNRAHNDMRKFQKELKESMQG
jgi:hypothetical protein